MDERDLHKQEQKLSKAMSLLERSEVREENKQLIHTFIRDLRVDGIKPLRLIRYVQTLRLCAERWCSKPFSEWTEEDLKDVILKVEEAGFKPKDILKVTAIPQPKLRRFFSPRWARVKVTARGKPGSFEVWAEVDPPEDPIGEGEMRVYFPTQGQLSMGKP